MVLAHRSTESTKEMDMARQVPVTALSLFKILFAEDYAIDMTGLWKQRGGHRRLQDGHHASQPKVWVAAPRHSSWLGMQGGVAQDRQFSSLARKQRGRALRLDNAWQGDSRHPRLAHLLCRQARCPGAAGGSLGLSRLITGSTRRPQPPPQQPRCAP